MKIIHENPYRIAGLLSNIGAKDISRQKSRIKRLNEIGQTITSEYDFSFLPPISRTKDKVDKAFSDIEQNQNKVNHSLFWFINTNPVDQLAIQHLISGNKEKAIEIWGKLVIEKEVSAQNFSAYNNIGTIYFSDSSQEKLKQGIIMKIKLLESDYYSDFALSVADETFTIDPDKQIQIFIDVIISELKEKFTPQEWIELFSNCSEQSRKHLTQKFSLEPSYHVEKEIEKTKDSRNKDPKNADKFGNNLYKNTKTDLALLKSLSASKDPQYNLLADNVAKEILQCSIDYFNVSQDEGKKVDYHTKALKLAKLAKSVAVNPITKGRIDDSILQLEGMKDKILDEVIMFLLSVRATYEKNEDEIRSEVKRLEKNDPLIITGYRTINWVAVEESIENSIDWLKVERILREILTDQNLNKIKNSTDKDKKEDFLALLKWLERHSRRKSSIIKLREDYMKIPPNLPFRIMDSEILNTSKNGEPLLQTTPLYNKYTRYISLKLEIEPTEEKTIELFLKYYAPTGLYKSNSSTSPHGYTLSAPTKITMSTRFLQLPGWGNPTTCTFEIGIHRINVYVEGHLIYKREFRIEYSPSEKIENEIKNVESELNTVSRTHYFGEEIKKAQLELEEIKRFKLLRFMGLTKDKIQNAEQKIEMLHKKALEKRLSEEEKLKEKIEKLKQELSHTKD